MDATALPVDAPLPDDVGALQALVRRLLAELAELRAENARLRAENDALKAKLDAALKHRFGQRSERRRVPPVDKKEKPGKATPHGRAALPEHLERREVVYDLTEEEKLCPCCGKERVCIGPQVTEQLDLQPAVFFVLRTVRKTYVCRECDPEKVPAEQRFRTAGPPEVGPVARGLCGSGLLAHVITAKYADHVPVHRLAGQLARSGVEVAPSTLGGWLAAAAALLMPLYELMHKRLLLSRVIHSDDTGVKLRVAGQKKTKRAHLWVYIGDADYPYVMFGFTADYTATGPEAFLKGYKGYLQADALAQYEGLYALGLLHACCMAHSRRKFVAAQESSDRRAEVALELIGKLYALERELPPLLPPADDAAAQERRRQREEERRRLRQDRARPILDELKEWLDEQRPKALPKTPLGQAIGYALNNWEALCRYVEQGYLAIDNNLSERTLRAIAVGRNNWGVIGSAAGGETAAVLYSIAGTCKHLCIDPFSYLREALPGLFALGAEPKAEQLAAWLPDAWQRRRAAQSPAAADTG